MTYPFVGFGVPDAPLPFDVGTFAFWLVLNVVGFVVLLAVTLRLALPRDGRAEALVANDDPLRVDLRMAA